MSGHHPFEKLRARMTPEQLAQAEAKAQELKGQMPLHELRQARAQSQADLAKRLEVNQPAVAKMERRADMYVSNLRRFIEGMGGELEIVAHFPEGSVTITNFSEVEVDKCDPSEQAAEA